MIQIWISSYQSCVTKIGEEEILVLLNHKYELFKKTTINDIYHKIERLKKPDKYILNLHFELEMLKVENNDILAILKDAT